MGWQKEKPVNLEERALHLPQMPYLLGAMYEHLRVVPPGKRPRVPSCTRPEILGSG